MDLTRKFSFVCVLIFVYFQGIHTFTVRVSKSPEKAQYGTNTFQLTCTYSPGTGEVPTSFRWLRQRNGESTFTIIAVFFPPENTNFNASIRDTDLAGRASQTTPTPTDASSTLTMTQVRCTDEAQYQCEASFNTMLGSNTTRSTVTVEVTTVATFAEETPIPYTPNADLMVGDEVTFTCSDNVGKNPEGTLHWYYFLEGQSVGTDVTSLAIANPSIYSASTCSYTVTSTLKLSMEKRYNQFAVRCTLHQFSSGEQGDGVRHTERINVQYAPSITTISKSPDHTDYVRGTSVTLTCSGEGNPSPSVQWTLSNGTVVQSSQLSLSDLSLTANHTYVCRVQNTIQGVNYTDNRTVVLSVVETTTTTTTTPSTTTPSVTVSTPAGNPGGSQEQTDDDKVNVGAIVGGVVGGVVFLVVLIVVIFCYCRRKSKPEIEEPPDIKPRTNNQSYYGARPDLVTDEKMKNSRTGLNASFNNSFDSSESKPRNDDGLMYVDLAFDDKPRSRKPIQMMDTGNTSYADIAMPRV